MTLGERMTKVILGIVIASILLGYVFPVGLNAVNDDPSYEVNLEQGNETVIQERLNATATDVNATSDEATIEVKDTQTGTTETQTISNGSTVQYNGLEGGYVNVTVNSVNSGSPDNVDTTFVVEQGFAWSDASQRIFGVLGLFLILVPLIVLARQTMSA